MNHRQTVVFGCKTFVQIDDGITVGWHVGTTLSANRHPLVASGHFGVPRGSRSDVLITQYTTLEIFQHELINQRGEDGDGEDAGHHADHDGGFTGVRKRAAEVFAEADQHFCRNQRAPCVAEGELRDVAPDVPAACA